MAHLLAVLALAASPRLHQWVHPDADDDQDCAVLLFLHGSGDVPVGPICLPVFVRLAVPLMAARILSTAFVPSVFAVNRVFEHGPPCVG